MHKGVKGHEYDYNSTVNGDNYVLKAILQNPMSERLSRYALNLDNDLDGEVIKIWCGRQGEELEFCFGPNNQ